MHRKISIALIAGALLIVIAVAYSSVTRIIGPQVPAVNTGYASQLYTPGGAADSVKFVVYVTGGSATGKLMYRASYQGVYEDTVLLGDFSTSLTNSMRAYGYISADSLRSAALPAKVVGESGRADLLLDTENFRYQVIWQEWSHGAHTGSVVVNEIRQ